jgi:hypothetical protein
MMKRVFAAWIVTVVLLVPALVAAEDPASGQPKADCGMKPLPRVDDKVRTMELRPGLLDLYVDHQRGRIWLVTPPPDGGGLVGEFLYIEGLVTGLGSNPVGLDRGQIGPTLLVRLRRVGSRILVEVPNLGYRSQSSDTAERRAAVESFAPSVLWAGEIAAVDPNGRALIDLTGFLVRDAHGVVQTMKATEQGTFELDLDRSAIDVDSVLAFPDNLEFEAVLTYASDEPGEHVRSTAPVAEAFTLRQHHSLIRLPDSGYTPRPFDPRVGVFATTFLDFSEPLGRPLDQRWIVRHRLQKTDPKAERSPVKEPIVYYVDRGAPEPVRSALVDGARWWATAFDAAGFEDAFRVELLPEEAHPLDIRYNVIQWVHRSTRGWSYGGWVADPRTGEILKGQVSLGSLRVRHDTLLFEGLIGADQTRTGAPDDPVELALARIRQLSAHEVGHTLGLAHNFAASTYGGRASVMDYPAPLVRITNDGELDFSEVYGVGVGAWDVHVIRWAYSQFPPGADVDSALDAIVHEGFERGLLYMSDQDARPAGAAHPLANLWDNGSDPVEELERVLAVRRNALDRFGERNIAPGQPLARLQEVLVPVYLYHRYQLNAAVKVVGGLEYRYTVRGDRQPPMRSVSAAHQRRALGVLLSTLDPAELDLSDQLLAQLPPRPPGHWPTREVFGGHTAPMLDPLSAATTAADLTLRAILQPERLARLVDQHRRDADLPGMEEVLNAVIDAVFPPALVESNRLREIRRAIQQVAADRLVGLAGSDDVSPAVRWRAEGILEELVDRLAEPGADTVEDVFRRTLRRDLERFLKQREWSPRSRPVALPEPPGDPIGIFTSCAWH